VGFMPAFKYLQKNSLVVLERGRLEIGHFWSWTFVRGWSKNSPPSLTSQFERSLRPPSGSVFGKNRA